MISLSQLLTVTGLGDSKSNYRAAVHGLVLPRLAEHPTLASRSLGWHFCRIERALELEQIRLHFDHFGRCCGYAWWTRAATELEAQLLKSGPEGLDVSDFSAEGGAWMVDFRAAFVKGCPTPAHALMFHVCRSCIGQALDKPQGRKPR